MNVQKKSKENCTFKKSEFNYVDLIIFNSFS